MATVTQSTLSAEIKTYYDMRLLLRAIPNLVHGRFGERGIIPKNRGDTIEWRKFTELPVVTSPLSEGVTPASEDPAVTTVTATPKWYGSYVLYTEELEFTSIDPVVENFSDLLGEQAGRSIDQLIRTDLVSGFTNVVYPGTISALADITADMVMDWALWSKAVATLANKNALGVNGDRYAAILHPHVFWGDLMQDDTLHKLFQATAFADNDNPFARGYVGTIMNVDVYVTSNAYVNTNAGAGSTVDVYYSMFIGRQAYGVSGISGTEPRDIDMGGSGTTPGGLTGQTVRPMNLIVKPKGSSGTADPLDMRGSVAWKATNTTVALDANFAVVARHASALGTN